MNANKISTLLGSAFLASSAYSHAASVFATHDTFVKRDEKTLDAGSQESVLLKTQNGLTNTRIAFLGFDLSTVTQPVTAVSLDLHVFSIDSTLNYNLYGIPEGNADESFDESTFNFNGSDVVGGGGNPDNSLDESKLTLLTTFTLTTSQEETRISLSDANLLAFIQADTNDRVSFVINSSSFDNAVVAIASSETTVVGRSGPSLEITTVPEPSSLMLGAIGALALLRRRK